MLAGTSVLHPNTSMQCCGRSYTLQVTLRLPPCPPHALTTPAALLPCPLPWPALVVLCSGWGLNNQPFHHAPSATAGCYALLTPTQPAVLLPCYLLFVRALQWVARDAAGSGLVNRPRLCTMPSYAHTACCPAAVLFAVCACPAVGGEGRRRQPPGQPATLHPPRRQCSSTGSRPACGNGLLLERPGSAVCCTLCAGTAL